MNLKYSFVYIVFLCSFGTCLLIVMTHVWWKSQHSVCSSFNIDIASTEKFKEALTFKNNSKWIDDFQPVTDDVYVYSAYADGQNKVRVIGVTNDTHADLFCILWYKGPFVTTRLVRAFIANINENHGKRITAAYFLCYFCDLDVPDAVSIVQRSSLHNPSNILPVHKKHDQEKKTTFTMCVSPLHASFNDHFHLLEWVEFNKILGVEKFVIYVKSVSTEVKKLLKFYQEHDDMVKLLPWTLKDLLCDGIQMHYCGQLAALNDCLYRNKGYSRYIALTDVDELIIPQHKDDFTWHDMLERIPPKSVYMFGNSFILPNEKYNKNINVTEDTLFTDNLMRDGFIYGPRDRSKLIGRTDDVVTFGIHNVWALRKGVEYFVGPSVGLLHHYRKETVIFPKDVTVTRVKSNVTLKYSKELKARIALTHKKLKQIT